MKYHSISITLIGILVAAMIAFGTGHAGAQDIGDAVLVDKEVLVLDGQACAEYFEAVLYVNGSRPDVPADIVLLFDRSSSMKDGGDGCTIPGFETEGDCNANGGIWGPQPITGAREAAKVFVDELDTDDRIALVSYSSYATLDASLTQDRDSVKTAIDDIEAHGFTNIAAALDAGMAELTANGRPEAVKVIILLSDGVANRAIDPDCDENGCGTYPCAPTCCSQNAIDIGDQVKDAGMYVFSVFLRNLSTSDPGCILEDVESYGAQTLREISSGDDFFFEPQSPAELPLVYDFINTRIPPAASNLLVTDEVAPEFAIVADSIEPTPLMVEGNRITWAFDVLGEEQRMFRYELVRATAGLPPGPYATSTSANLDFIDAAGNDTTLPFPQIQVDLSGDSCGEMCLGQGRASLLIKGGRAIGSALKFKLASAENARFKLFMDLGTGPVAVPGVGVFCLEFSENREMIAGGSLSPFGFRHLWWSIPAEPELVGRTMAFQFAAEDPLAPHGVAISNAYAFELADEGTEGDECNGGLRELGLMSVSRYEGAFPVDVSIRAAETGDGGQTIGQIDLSYDPNDPPTFPLESADGGLTLLGLDVYRDAAVAQLVIRGCHLDGDRLPDGTTVEVSFGTTDTARAFDTSCNTPIGAGSRFSPFYVTHTADVDGSTCD